MLIRDWMTRDVVTVDENTSLMRATRLMKDNNIRRLPVVAKGKLVGILTDKDVKDASPSKMSSLDIHELYYLFSQMQVKKIMTPLPITLQENDSMEKAAIIMVESKITGLPVVDGNGYLTGVLSETDILRCFLHSSGMQDGSLQYAFDLEDRPGAVTEVVQTLRQNKVRIVSMFTSFEDASEGKKRVLIRIAPTSGNGDLLSLTKLLMQRYDIVYYCHEELANLPQKA